MIFSLNLEEGSNVLNSATQNNKTEEDVQLNKLTQMGYNLC